MTYLPDLNTRRQVAVEDDALSVRIAYPGASISAFGVQIAQPESSIVQMQFQYGILGEHVNLSASNGGYVSSSSSMVNVNCGPVSNGYAALESKLTNHYVAGVGGRCKFAGYFVSGGLAGSTQEAGIGDRENGLFFGYSGSAFGSMRRTGGVDIWTPQTEWSIDRMDGQGPSQQTLAPVSGNVYMITYQWLGFGAIMYYIENGSTGMFYPVHRIGYANTHNMPSLEDPNLPLRIAARSWGSTGSVAVNVSSIGAMVEGENPVFGMRRSSNDSAAGVSTEVALLSIMNSASFNGRTNRVKIKIDSFSIASRDTNNQTTYRLVMNAALGGSPSFVPASASNSPVSVDKSATTVTGGREIMFVGLGPNGHDLVNIDRYNIYVAPGETLTLTASGSNSTVVGGISWLEEI